MKKADFQRHLSLSWILFYTTVQTPIAVLEFLLWEMEIQILSYHQYFFNFFSIEKTTQKIKTKQKIPPKTKETKSSSFQQAYSQFSRGLPT